MDQASINNDTLVHQLNMANNDNENGAELPILVASVLETPESQPSLRSHMSTLKKLQQKEKELQQQLQHIQELEFTIAIQESHKRNLIHGQSISCFPSALPGDTETPRPHRSQVKPERPEDITCRQKLEQQHQAEYVMDETIETANRQPDQLMNIFKSLTKVLQFNNLHLQSSDVSEPTKFNESDTQWDNFYL
jgi:hypothetical protein